MLCPMLHLPEVSKAADSILILISGGPNMGMSALNHASLEIQKEFKAGEHVVFEHMWMKIWVTEFKWLCLGQPIWKQA